MQAVDKGTEAWTHYWRSGHLATCFMGAGQTRDFDLDGFWSRFFSGFGNETVILDICTGNGAVALLAAETALREGKTFWVHGVDSAKINPHSAVRNAPGALKRVRFWPGVDVGNLPFENSVIDGISGQYALEYTDRVRSIPELARVLRPGGRIGLLVHTRSSDVVRASGAALDDLKTMFETLRIFRTAQTAFNRLYPDDGRTPDRSELSRKHLAAVEDFENRLARLSELAGRGRSHALNFTAERLGTLYSTRKRYRKADILRFVSDLEREMRLYRIRMKAICQAALDEPEVREVAAAFAAQGLEMEDPAPLTVDPGERQVGWQIFGMRPGVPSETG